MTHVKDGIVRILSEGGRRTEACRHFDDHLTSRDVLIFQIAGIALQ